MMPIPVKCEWDLDSLGLHCTNDHPYIMEQTFPSSSDMCNSLWYPSEDLWKKFELLDNPGQNIKLFLEDSSTDDEGDLDVVFDCSSLGKSAAREIRHHDCMWAGRCGSKDHKSFLAEHHHHARPTARKATRVTAKRDVVATPPSVVKSATSLLRTDLISVTPGSSLLRTTIKQVVLPSSMKDSSYSLDSDGGSPRPDTPQTSESEDDDDHLVFKHNLDISSSVSAVCGDDSSDLLQYSEEYRTPNSSEASSSGCEDDDDDDDDDDEDEDDEDYEEECDGSEFDIEVPSPSTAVAVSEVTGQQRPVTLATRPITVIKQQHFTGDHSYHQSNTPVDLDKLGVQTPSDSEEEIDVVSFCDGEQPTSRSSSCGGVSLPTNPSDQDRRQLQLAVKSAIATKKRTAETKVATSIRAIGDKILMDVRTIKKEVEVKNNTMKARNSKKRTATSSDRDEEKGRFKGVKRAKHQYHHRLQHHKLMSPVRNKKAGSTGSSSPHSGSSDSEPESLEKRNLHNNMERQRRIDLRNLVEGLRLMVPSVETKNRAAKVIILREASNYCQYLTEQYEESSSELQALRMKQNKLRQRVSALRREAAKVR